MDANQVPIQFIFFVVPKFIPSRLQVTPMVTALHDKLSTMQSRLLNSHTHDR